MCCTAVCYNDRLSFFSWAREAFRPPSSSPSTSRWSLGDLLWRAFYLIISLVSKPAIDSVCSHQLSLWCVTQKQAYICLPRLADSSEAEGKTETVPVDRICCPDRFVYTKLARARIGVVVAVVRFSGQQERAVCVLHKGLTATIVSFSPAYGCNAHTHTHPGLSAHEDILLHRHLA